MVTPTPLQHEGSKPTNNGGAAKAERDRFVALAFCWADFLLEVDEDQKVVFAGGPWQGLVGMPADKMAGMSLKDIILDDDQPLMESLLGVARRKGRIEDVALRFKGKGAAGLPISFAGYFMEDLGRHYFLAMRVSQRQSAGLAPGGHSRVGETNLYDANSFADVLGGKLKAAKGKGDDTKLTMINMPALSKLEERLEESEATDLKKTLGVYLRANSVDGDSAAQLDEGKFGLVHGHDLDVKSLEEQLAIVAKDFDPEGKGVEVKAATMNVDADAISEEDLANGLLYAINRFKESDSTFDMHSLSSNLSQMVSDAAEKVTKFKSTVAEGNFHLVFHPIVEVQTGEVHHYEALTRFEPGVSPFELITMAEETGMISEFDMAVAQKGLDWLNKTPRNSKSSIAVNISGHSVFNQKYVEQLNNMLKENPWAEGRLLFEITESAKMEDLETANNFIQSLRKQRYHVCLDDFGAGAASFGYLMSLEVDVVKLDGPVVKDAQKARRGKALLQSMATLCKNLGIETIAEMVDSKEGLDFVRKCGINYAQGYLFGKPDANIKKFDMTQHKHLFPKSGGIKGRTGW